WLAYILCRKAFPGRTEISIGVPLLLAFLPQDAFYSVNSDILSPILFTAVFILLLDWREQKRPSLALSAAIGILVAATFRVKFTNVVLAVIFGIVVLAELRRRVTLGKSREFIMAALVALLAAALPVTVFFARNYQVFGNLSGTQSKVQELHWTRRPV